MRHTQEPGGLLIFLLAVATAGCSASLTQTRAAEPAAPVNAPAPQGPAHAPGELLVKFTSEAAGAIEEARAVSALPALGIDSLGRLFAAYGVTAIEPTVPAAGGPGAGSPDLARVYTLAIDPAADVVEASRVFADDPHVEYAQPNYLAAIVAPEGSP